MNTDHFNPEAPPTVLPPSGDTTLCPDCRFPARDCQCAMRAAAIEAAGQLLDGETTPTVLPALLHPPSMEFEWKRVAEMYHAFVMYECGEAIPADPKVAEIAREFHRLRHIEIDRERGIPTTVLPPITAYRAVKLVSDRVGCEHDGTIGYIVEFCLGGPWLCRDGTVTPNFKEAGIWPTKEEAQRAAEKSINPNQ